MQQYLKGELTPARMHAVEKHVLECSLCADALEGYETTQATPMPDLHIKTESKPAAGEISLRRLAAVLLLLIIAGSVYFIVERIAEPEQTIASNRQREVQKEEAYQEEARPLPAQPEESPEAGEEKVRTDQLQPKAPVVSPAKPAAGDQAYSSEIAKAEAGEAPQADDEDAMPDEPVIEPIATLPLEEEMHLEIASSESDSPDQEIISEEAEIAQRDISNSLSGKVAGVQLSRENETSAAAPMRKSVADVQSKSVNAPRIIKGKVISAEDGLPLPGVAVRIAGSEKGVMTDFDGEYEIEVSESKPALTYSYVGFEQLTLPLSDTTSLVLARLEEDVQPLSEVVVIGYEAEQEFSEPSFIAPKPVEGRKAYKEYIERNIQYPEAALEDGIEGTVKLEVTIGADGTLKQIEIIKSPGHGLDKEAIRLVKEGPAWLAARRNGTPVEHTIKLKVKFKLP